MGPRQPDDRGDLPWLPVSFSHPGRLDLPTGHHLRPIRATDVEIDYPAVLGSRESLWSRYGPVWGWPPAAMTWEQDRDDLARHQREMEAGISFNYAILDDAETKLLGCVYIDPPGPEMKAAGHDVVVSWWVIDAEAGSDLERVLATSIPNWLGQQWPFRAVGYGP